MNEAQTYTAADLAIAHADALAFSAAGLPATDARAVAQWTADTEAVAACLLAALVGPAYFRTHYRSTAAQFAAFSA